MFHVHTSFLVGGVLGTLFVILISGSAELGLVADPSETHLGDHQPFRGVEAQARRLVETPFRNDRYDQPLQPHKSPHEARSLLQTTETSGACSLSRRQLQRYLNREKRRWRLDDAALSELDNDVQAVMDCTEEGDVVVFDVSQPIRPATRITIQWSLFLTSRGSERELTDGVFRTNTQRASFNCPRENEGLFVITGGSVLFDSFDIEACTSSNSTSPEAIVEVTGCSDPAVNSTLQLHHVTFRDNDMSGSSLLRVNSPCTAVELMDVALLDNACLSVCALLSPVRNDLTNVTLKRNRLVGMLNRPAGILHSPAGSQTRVLGIRASNNAGTVFDVIGSEVLLNDSVFTENSVEGPEEHVSLSACLRLFESAAEIVNSTFRSNTAVGGAAIYAKRSNVALLNCTLELNEAAHGGALYLEDTSNGSLTDCHFRNNAATATSGGSCYIREGDLKIYDSRFEGGWAPFGGVVYADGASLEVYDSSFSYGNATYGGCIAARRRSQVRAENVSFDGSSAEFGGAVLVDIEASARLRNCRFASNLATNRGGGVCAQSASAVMHNCSFSDNAAGLRGGAVAGLNASLEVLDLSSFHANTAEFGGAVALFSRSIGHLRDSNFSQNTADVSGAAVHIEQAELHIQSCSYRGGQAENSGSLMSVASNLTISETTFESGSSVSEGGCLSLRSSSVQMENVTLRQCHSNENGGAVAVRDSSTLEMRRCTLYSCRTQHDGGAIYMTRSTVEIRRTEISASKAGGYGGGIFADVSSTIALLESTLSENVAQFGGAVATRDHAQVTAHASRFFSSSADFDGGSWHIRGSHVLFNQCRFDGSTVASGKGGILYTTLGAHVNLDHSSLTNGKARLGGCLSAEGNSSVLMDNTTLTNSRADEGGAVYVMEAQKLYLYSCNAINNTAEERCGGAIYLVSADLIAEDTVFENNHADDDGGGAIYCAASQRVEISETAFLGNKASRGGAMVLERNCSARFERISVRDNSATRNGGAWLIDAATANFTESTFIRNAARNGGCLSLLNANVSVFRSAFRGSRGEVEGGFIHAEGSSVEIRDVTMTNGTARRGGAMALSDTAMDARELEVTYCEASRGGAVSIESTEALPVDYLFSNCSFRYNTAVFGGAIHAIHNSGRTDCRECPLLVLHATEIRGNTAKSAGGGVMLFDSGAFRFWCRNQTTGYIQAPFRRDTLIAGNTLGTMNDVCEEWNGNDADGFGPDVATYNGTVGRSLEPDCQVGGGLEPGNSLRFTNHPSGVALPTLQLAVLDELGQLCTVGLSGNPIEATMTSTDFFTGNFSVAFTNGCGHFSGVVGIRPPGEYHVSITFSEDYLPRFEIQVEIRKCQVGETVAASGAFCQNCSGTTYSFSPEDTETGCHPCPSGGLCDLAVIRPQQGYWHMSPCSSHLQKCLRHRACDFEERAETLYNLTAQLNTCELNSSFLEHYREAQCRKGHEGPLCGSCASNHGKVQLLNCKACFPSYVNILFIFLLAAVLCLLAGVNIKSVGHEGDNNQGDPEQQGGQNGSENQKYKAAEIVKICVSYLQATSIAGSINVNWGASLLALFETGEFLSGLRSEAVHRSVDCLMPSNASINRSIFSALIDLALPFAVFLAFLPFHLLSRYVFNKPVVLWKPMILSFMAVIYVSYTSFTKTLIEIFTCIEVHDAQDDGAAVTEYWIVDTSIKCSEGAHAVLVGAAGWPLLILITVGFPCLILYLAWPWGGNAPSRGVYQIAGFTYRAYKPRFSYWEFWILVRKALLAGVVVLAYPLGAQLQSALAIMVLALASCLQAACQPFGKNFSELNLMESLSILFSLFTLAAYSFFEDDDVSHPVRAFVTVLIVICDTGLFLYFVWSALCAFAEYLKASRLVNSEPRFRNEDGTVHVLVVYVWDFVLRPAIQETEKFRNACWRGGVRCHRQRRNRNAGCSLGSGRQSYLAHVNGDPHPSVQQVNGAQEIQVAHMNIRQQP